MSRPNRIMLGMFLVGVFVFLVVPSLLKGGFYIGKHEGDTLHLLQMVFRMSAGEWPHLDFQTPIGVLAMAPIALFVKLGFGAGHAILYSQILVALIALPVIWYVATSRFPGIWAYIFGGFVLVLILALVHGESQPQISISMHYNRWAWAAAYLALATAVLPPRPGRAYPVADGAVLGMALAALALIKVTYFAAFLIPITVALLGRKSWKAIGVALLSGLAVAGVLTLLTGTPAFWLAYLRDLLTVAGSEVRPQPSASLFVVASAPAYLGGSIAALFGVVFLRQAHRALEGLVLLLLVPAFIYVTYQNYANDPQWLALLGLFLITLRPGRELHNGLGWDVRQALTVTAVAAFAFILPSGLNLAYSPYLHFGMDEEDYVPLLPGSGVNEDLQVARKRGLPVRGLIAMDQPGSVFAARTDQELHEDIVEWNGETWPPCSVETGLVNWFETIADDLNAAGLAEGKTAFVADLLSSFWLYGAFEPLPGASPWYYGGLPGFEHADYLLVPNCPISTKVRKLVLEAVEASGATFTEVRRTEMYVLYEK